MKIRYLLTIALGAIITLTSCKPAEPEKQTETTKTTRSADYFNQFKSEGKVVTLEDLEADFNSPEEAFNAALQSGFVVVDFFASWCGPCQTMEPYFASVTKQLSKKLNALFVKVNIDQYPSIVGKYSVRSIPTLVFFNNGSIVKRNAGMLSESALSKMVSATF